MSTGNELLLPGFRQMVDQFERRQEVDFIPLFGNGVVLPVDENVGICIGAAFYATVGLIKVGVLGDIPPYDDEVSSITTPVLGVLELHPVINDQGDLVRLFPLDQKNTQIKVSISNGVGIYQLDYNVSADDPILANLARGTIPSNLQPPITQVPYQFNWVETAIRLLDPQTTGPELYGQLLVR